MVWCEVYTFFMSGMNSRRGVLIRCGKCRKPFGESIAGAVWIVRPEREREGIGFGAPGPVREKMIWYPAVDGKPHRFDCRCGAIWHVRDLPKGAPGSKYVLH